MAVNNTQIGNTRLEPLFLNSPINDNLDQLLSVGLQASSQNLIQFTMTASIPTQIPMNSHVRQSSKINSRQEGRRRQRQRRRERQRRKRPNELHLPQRQQLSQQTRNQRSRTWSEMSQEKENWCSIGFEEYLEENITPALEEYDWEKNGSKGKIGTSTNKRA